MGVRGFLLVVAKAAPEGRRYEFCFFPVFRQAICQVSVAICASGIRTTVEGLENHPAGHSDGHLSPMVSDIDLRQAGGLRLSSSSGSLAKFTAIRRASSLVSSFATERRPGSSSK